MYEGYGYWGNPGFGRAPQPQMTQPFNRYPTQAPQVDMSQGQRPPLQVPWVNGEVGAQAYLIAPNSSVLLMDSDSPTFYIKTSDMSGKAVIQAFKYEELKAAPQAPATPAYVTREEFEAFKANFVKPTDEKTGKEDKI